MTWEFPGAALTYEAPSVSPVTPNQSIEHPAKTTAPR